MEFNYKASFMLFICFTLVSFWNILPTSQSIIAQTDRLALLAFKDKITDDPLGVLNSWNASSHCSNWTGITCSRRHPSRVTRLVLESMGLVGTISPYIGNLSFLRVISLLSTLDLGSNQFTGSVPPSLGNLKNLTRLNIERNYLGRGDIDGLRFLNSLPNCSKLETLSISFNNFSGQLPDSIANLSTKLTILYVGANNIFGKLSNLISLDLSGNQLTGKIPSNICNNTRLERISFSTNKLQGGIPPIFGNCQKMMLTGDLPSEVGNLNRIVYLYLSNNQLSGRIPDSLGKCIGLEELSLAGNLFEWVIPASLASLEGLQRLDMSGNKLSGRIPKYLESFVSLKYLNLSSNDFEGEVPKQGIFKNVTGFSVRRNDKLCGGIPLLHLPSCPRPGFDKASKRSPLKRLLLIIFGVVVCVILLGFFLIWFWRRKATKKTSSPLSNPLDNMFQKVSYNELLKATNGFSAENLVGVGSYGSVYKGLLSLTHEVTTVVAVKFTVI
ncbi:LRR receptor-like serine/threonine-protein kinase EFR [Papaver somniferum]|uniref:LRR receptor-like serine/threonine-protein kinase EFR n=1 Tax=Papaver somniferum TaxID=3469 RepID=UPI000E70455D|nr:LRR receptor-like serine/threonine-protein kinase EFR [Papaver somniferum]